MRYRKLTYISTVFAVVDASFFKVLLHLHGEVLKLGLDRPEQRDRVESGVCLSCFIIKFVSSLPRAISYKEITHKQVCSVKNRWAGTMPHAPAHIISLQKGSDHCDKRKYMFTIRGGIEELDVEEYRVSVGQSSSVGCQHDLSDFVCCHAQDHHCRHTHTLTLINPIKSFTWLIQSLNLAGMLAYH